MKRLLSTLLLCLVASTTALFAQQRHTLTLKTSPQGLSDYTIMARDSYGFTYKTGHVFQIVTGDRVSVSLNHLVTGWKVREWRATEGHVELDASGNSVYLNMPDEDVTLTLLLDYNPDNPDNPMPNGWYPDDGKLVIDYLNEQYFNEWFNKILTDKDYELVTSVIVGGRQNYSESDVLSRLTPEKFPSLRRVDISRTENNSSSDNIRLYDAKNRPWEELLLPPSTVYIGSEAFKGTFLNELTIFATTPPQLSYREERDAQGNIVRKQNCFPTTAGLKVFVPAEALPLYQADPLWKDFELEPIVEDAANLSVNVQAPGGDMSPYFGMRLEIRDVKNLYTRVMLIGNRANYPFMTLPKYTSYDVRLLSRTGSVVAQAQNVRLEEEDISVTLSGLRRPCALQLALSDGTAAVAADKYQCLWTDAEGLILGRGNNIDGILEDEPLQAVLILTDQALKATFRERDTISVTPNPQQPVLSYQLKPIPTHRLTTVVKRADGQFFGRQTATVTIHRSGSGELVRQLSFGQLMSSGGLTSGLLEPLPEGEYEVTASVDVANMGTVTRHLSLYADQTLNFELAEARGSSVSLKWTHHGVGDDGAADAGSQMQPTQAAITLRDLTNGRNLTDFSFTPNGNLRLQELLEPGTKVELTLGNRGGSQFAPAVLSAVADAEGNLSYDVHTSDYGTLRVSFTDSESSRVSVRVYDAQGALVSSGNAVTTVKDIPLLPDGTYTVVLMEGGTMANAMSTLADVVKFLHDGIDYVAQQVNIGSGIRTQAEFYTVPAMSNNARLYTDEAATRVAPKKSSVTIGTYQTISAKVSFCPEYRGRISQLKAVFTLPDNVNFIDGSLIVDNAQVDYTRNGQQITVPIIENRLLRFCLVPHGVGEQAVSARITFQLDGTSCEQPLPVTTFTAEAADIQVVSPSASKEVKVIGTALPQVPVTVFVNDQKAGTTTSNIHGEWNMVVPLTDANNMDENTIYAQFEGNDGYLLKTEPKTVVYDRNCIFPVSVRMSHYNEYARAEMIVNFDLVNNICSQSSYSFYHTAEFTFDVKLNTPDSAYIDNVLLYVYMNGDQRRILFTKYNKPTGTWVASDVFDTTGLPSTVRVVVEEHAPKVFSEKSISELVHYLDNMYDEYVAEDTETKGIIADVERTTPGTAEGDEALRQLMIHSGINPDLVRTDDTLPDTPEAQSQWNQEMDQALATIDAALSGYDKLQAEGFFDVSRTPYNQLGNVLGGYTFSRLSASARQYYAARAQGMAPASSSAAGSVAGMASSPSSPAGILSSAGQEEYEMTLENGSHIYYRLSDNGYVITIPDEDLQITCNYDAISPEVKAAVRQLRQAQRQLEALSRVPLYARDAGFIDEISSILDKVGAAILKVSSEIDLLKQRLDDIVKAERIICEGCISDIQQATQAGWDKFWKANSKWVNNDKFIVMRAKAAVALEKIQALRKAKGYLEKAAKGLGNIGKILNVVGLISDGNDIIESGSKLIELYYSIPDPCKNEQDKANSIANSIKGWGAARLAQKGYSFINNAVSVAAAIAGVASTGATGGLGTVAGVALSAGISLANYIGNKVADNYWNKWIKDWERDINALKCDSVPCQKKISFDLDMELDENGFSSTGSSGGSSSSSGSKPCGNDQCQKARSGGTSPGKCPGPPPPPGPKTTPILDPSGYVYEAVGSNRVPDALTSIFYKDLYEDMYGDTHERAVMWDAENFDQINPMLTDENGEYGWDVPAGLWQVRVVKDGYLTTESQWLPVPPPQLDVNLELQQPSAPVVQRVVATEQGVDLRFDKYMKPAHLTTDNIFLTRDGQKLEGTLRLMDAEYTPDSTRTFARRVMFIPAQPLKMNQQVRLTVKAGIESYANVGMVNDYTQEFDVQQQVSELVADSVVGILHGDQYTLTVSALPASVARGKKVTVHSLNPDIASIAATQLTLDQNGQATVTIQGRGYGTTAVRLSLADDSDVQTLTVVGVKDADDLIARKPTASRISGTEVAYGSYVRLTTQTPGAVIYYTTDGSCPCDSPDRQRYEGPVPVLSDLTLKAIAVAPGYADSDVATFTYKVKYPEAINDVAVGDSPMDNIVFDLQGRIVSTPSSSRQPAPLKPGIYIRNHRKFLVR